MSPLRTPGVSPGVKALLARELEGAKTLKQNKLIFCKCHGRKPVGIYFGFSHWAIEELLERQGFEISEIRPGTSAFVVLASAMLPDMRMGSTIGKWVGRLSLSLLKVLGGLYIAIRFGTGSHKWEQYRDFLVKAPLRFSGHIMFVARKPTR